MIIYEDENIKVFKTEDADGEPLPDGKLEAIFRYKGHILIIPIDELFFEHDREYCLGYIMKFYKNQMESDVIKRTHSFSKNIRELREHVTPDFKPNRK